MHRGRPINRNTNQVDKRQSNYRQGIGSRSYQHRMNHGYTHPEEWEQQRFHSENQGSWNHQREEPIQDFRGIGPKNFQRTDERIYEEVCELLMAHPYVDASHIEVAVKNGVVTLDGSVKNRTQGYYAMDAVESVTGVRDVIPHFKITTTLGEFA